MGGRCTRRCCCAYTPRPHDLRPHPKVTRYDFSNCIYLFGILKEPHSVFKLVFLKEKTQKRCFSRRNTDLRCVCILPSVHTPQTFLGSSAGKIK